MVKYFFEFRPVLHNGHEDGFYEVLKLKSDYKVKMKADALLIKNEMDGGDFLKIQS